MAHRSVKIGVGVAVLVAGVGAAVWANWPRDDAWAVEAAANREKQAEAADKRARATRIQQEAVRHATVAALTTAMRCDERDLARAVASLRSLGPDALPLLREVFERGVEDPLGCAAAYALAHLGGEEDRWRIADEFIAHERQPIPLLALAAAELRDPHLAPAFAQMAGSAEVNLRIAAARGLRAASDPPVAALLPLLTDDEPRVRESAERSMLEVLPRADGGTVRRAAERALESSNPALRVAALRLGMQANARWTGDAAARAARDPDERVRHEAVSTLGRVGAPAAAEPLLGLVERGVDRRERIHAATALGTVAAPPEALDELARRTAAERDPMVALASARTLAAHRDPRAIPELVRLGEVRESKELDIDDEDAFLLRDMSTQILRAAAKDRPIQNGESWGAWWGRVGRDYRFPKDAVVPEFPWNH